MGCINEYFTAEGIAQTYFVPGLRRIKDLQDFFKTTLW